MTFFHRVGNAFGVDWHCLCDAMNVASDRRTKSEAYGTLKDKTCSILIADEILEPRLKIRERNISSKIRVLLDPIWTDAEK